MGREANYMHTASFSEININRHRMRKLATICVATVCTSFFVTVSNSDVVVYKKSCGIGAKEDWNLKCTITKNTFAGVADYWAEDFRNLQTITICASFDNHGGLWDSDVAIVYNHKDGSQSTPLAFFDTVKFEGRLVDQRLSWTGVSPRRDHSAVWASKWRMRGELLHRYNQQPSVYTESLFNGQRLVGEIRSLCSPLENE